MQQMQSRIMLIMKFVMLCQFYPSYNRILEMRLDNSKNQLKVNVKKMNLTIKLQMEEFDADSVPFLLQAVSTRIQSFFM